MIQDTSLPIHGEDVDGSFELRSLQSHGSVRKLTAPCSTVNFTEVRATVDNMSDRDVIKRIHEREAQKQNQDAYDRD